MRITKAINYRQGIGTPTKWVVILENIKSGQSYGTTKAKITAIISPIFPKSVECYCKPKELGQHRKKPDHKGSNSFPNGEAISSFLAIFPSIPSKTIAKRIAVANLIPSSIV